MTLILAVLALVFGLVWLLLPFALFGIKPRLDQQIAELREIRRALDRQSPKPAPAHAPVKACRSCSQAMRSEEHTSELKSLMRIASAVFGLEKKNKNQHT